jgi:hypothetical protein
MMSVWSLDVNDVDPADRPKPSKRRSIAHNILTDGSAVFLSLDIEIVRANG